MTKTVKRAERVSHWVAGLLLGVSPFAFAPDARAQTNGAELAGETRIEYNIPAQPLSSALALYAQQSGLSTLVPADRFAGQFAPAVRGRFTREEALSRLLSRSNLRGEITPANTLALEQEQGPQPRSANAETERVRAAANADAEAPSDEADEEIVVTGTRIRGAAPAGANLLSLDRGEIDATGRSTVQDVLATLPQNFPGSQGELTQLSALDGRRNIAFGSTVDLRGLGADATLTLVNGRRLAPSGFGNFVDISAIPLSAVQRIEVLADGASATYGADAVGGVVNIILNRSFEGAATNVRRGADDDGDFADFGVSQLFGAGWDGGHVMVGYEYRERDHLSASERAFTASSDLRALGGSNFSRTLSNPGNITRIGATNVSLAVPAGQDGTDLDASDFIVGVLNQEGLNEDAYLIPDQISHAVIASARQDLGDRVELFVDVLAGERSSYAEDTQIGATITIPESNYYRQLNGLFLGQGPLTMSYWFGEDLGPIRHITQSRGANLALGANIDLGAAWRLELAGTYARQREDVRIENTYESSPAVIAALASGNAATAFNPFADGSNTPASVLAGFSFDQTLENDSILSTFSLKADGPIFESWGGVARAAFGIERRRETFAIGRSIIRASGVTSPFLQAPGDRTTDAVLAEIMLPLLGSDRTLPLVQEFTLSASIRHEDADEFAATTPKIGFTWSLTESLTIRGTWGESFKAPQFQQMLGATAGSLIVATPAQDPFATGGSTGLLVLSGSNPNLEPEEAQTWTAGFVYRPTRFEGLSIEATYFDIDFANRITTPGSFLNALRDPTGLESVFTRNPTLAQVNAAVASVDIVAGSLPLSAVEVLYDNRLTNLASLRVRGVDLSASWTFDSAVGEWTLFASASGLLQYERYAAPGASGIELLDTMFNPVDWRGRFGATWSNNGWRAGLTGVYVDDYTDNLSSPTREIASSLTWDARIAYDWRRENDGQGPTLSLSVQNLFDEDPPFANNPIGYAFDSSNASPLGRVITLELQQRW